MEPVENVSFSNQNSAEQQQLKRHIQFKACKKKAPVSFLNRFNKTYNEADGSRTCKLAFADNHYELKHHVYLSRLDILPCNLCYASITQSMPVSLNLSCIFHITTSSNKWLLLACL